MNLLDIHTHNLHAMAEENAIVSYLPAELSVLPASGYYSLGIHPWELTEENAEEQLTYLNKLALLSRQGGEKRLLALGETGLDKLASASMELQVKVFEQHVLISEQNDLPLIIHCVKAFDELLAVRKKFSPVQSWILHGFRGKLQQAVQLLQQGFYLSFGKYYHNDAMVAVPADRLFLETDDSDENIMILLRRAAEMRGISVEELHTTLQENIRKVFFKV